MHHDHENTVFDAGDNTALVCVDHEGYQKAIVPQLIDMGYKVHLGLFEDDVILKLRTYSYDLVIIFENFKGTTITDNPILREMTRRPGGQRRDHFVILLTNRFATNDAINAFVQSVDQIVNVADLANLKPVLRRATAHHREEYHPFKAALAAAQAI